MSNNFNNDELRVEHYDAEDAAIKKKKILKRIGIGAGIAAILAILGYFGLNALQEKIMTEFIMGGNGAWFNSKMVFFGDNNG